MQKKYYTVSDQDSPVHRSQMDEICPSDTKCSLNSSPYSARIIRIFSASRAARWMAPVWIVANPLIPNAFAMICYFSPVTDDTTTVSGSGIFLQAERQHTRIIPKRTNLLPRIVHCLGNKFFLIKICSLFFLCFFHVSFQTLCSTDHLGIA